MLLLALCWRLGLLGSLRGRWRALVAYALVEIAIPFPLIAAGEQHVASSLAAILIASVPLIVAVLALRFDRAERATGSRLVGLFVGFAGVVALVGPRRRRRLATSCSARARSCSRRSATRSGRWSLKQRLARHRPARDDGRRARDRGAWR